MLRRFYLATLLTVVGLAIGSPAQATSFTINFDDISIPNGAAVAFPSNHYAAQGLTIQSLALPASVDAVGETFNLGAVFFSDSFGVINNDNSVSPPNFGVATNVFANVASAAFFSFTKPVDSLSLQTDDAPGEFPDVVRLMALRSLGGGNFEVMAVVFGLDNAVTAPDNTLTLNIPGGFNFAVFATATEAEGFDNIQFNAVPEPGTMVLVGSALVGALALRRRRVR